MSEAAAERIRKQQVDRQWDEYYQEEMQASPPTDAQLNQIHQLGTSVGMRIRLSSIESRDQAFRIISALTTLARRMNSSRR